MPMLLAAALLFAEAALATFASSLPGSLPAPHGARSRTGAASAAMTAAPAPSAVPSERLLRQLVAETALAQLPAPDPAWPEAQRDCAGLVRWTFRSAFRRLAPWRVEQGLWLDGTGKRQAFADAETLLAHSFEPMGRGEAARAALASGDLAAFRREDAPGVPVFHLMIVVRARDPAHGPTRVVYHPGEPGAAAREGLLEELVREAPAEWRPIPANPAFLGFFRFKEWWR